MEACCEFKLRLRECDLSETLMPKQKNFFTCGHRGFGTWCHRCNPKPIEWLDGKKDEKGNKHIANIGEVHLIDESRHVKGHGMPRKKTLGVL